MKFRVLALDYDGTIAVNGELNPDVRSAIVEARSRGLAVVLVMGPILEDLREVAGDLSFLDAIVAENGADLCKQGRPQGQVQVVWRHSAVLLSLGRTVFLRFVSAKNPLSIRESSG